MDRGEESDLQQIVHGLRSGADMSFDDISRVRPWSKWSTPSASIWMPIRGGNPGLPLHRGLPRVAAATTDVIPQTAAWMGAVSRVPHRRRPGRQSRRAPTPLGVPQSRGLRRRKHMAASAQRRRLPSLAPLALVGRTTAQGNRCDPCPQCRRGTRRPYRGLDRFITPGRCAPGPSPAASFQTFSGSS